MGGAGRTRLRPKVEELQYYQHKPHEADTSSTFGLSSDGSHMNASATLELSLARETDRTCYLGCGMVASG